MSLTSTIVDYSHSPLSLESMSLWSKSSEMKGILDLDTLTEITGGDREFQLELLQVFLEDTGSLIKRLRQGLSEVNWDKIKQESHTLKGSSSNLGAVKLCSIAGQIYTHSQTDQNYHLVEELFSELEDIWIILKSLITEEF